MPADPAKGPPRIEFNPKKAIEGGGEGVSEGMAGIAMDASIERSFDAQLKALQPEIQAGAERLRPAAEQMFMDDPTKPVYAIIHTKLPQQKDTAFGDVKARFPGSVSLAEPVQLKREMVNGGTR